MCTLLVCQASNSDCLHVRKGSMKAIGNGKQVSPERAYERALLLKVLNN